MAATLGPRLPPGLGGDKCGPAAPEADFFYREMELSYLVIDEVVQQLLQGYVPHAPSVNLATISQILLSTTPQILFSQLRKNPFPDWSSIPALVTVHIQQHQHSVPYL